MPYVLFFLKSIGYTLGALVICGLMISLCHSLYCRLAGHGFGRFSIYATSIIGTPIHELGHAVMCLIFGHRITAMSLWSPASKDGTLGYVTHSYNPKNPYHQIGNLFIGVGPIFSGFLVLVLVLWLAFPSTLESYMGTAREMVQNGENGFALFFEGLKMLPNLVHDACRETVPLWGRIVGLILILSVSMHIKLSPEDIKGSLRAIPLYLILIGLLTLITGLIGESAMTTVLGGLSLFSGYLTALFVPVLVASLIQLVPAFLIWCIRKPFSHH